MVQVLFLSPLLVLWCPQVFGPVGAEGGGAGGGDASSLPRFNRPGVDRAARPPCNGSSAEDHRGHQVLSGGDDAAE